MHQSAPDELPMKILPLFLAGSFLMAFGCETSVTEYRKRPSFYRMASEQDLTDEYVDAQGRTVKFIEDGQLPSERIRRNKERLRKQKERRKQQELDRKAAIAAAKASGMTNEEIARLEAKALEDMAKREASRGFKGRETLDDGSVVLRAMLPEHVLGHTMTCLRNREYILLWDEMIAQSTKDEYAARGLGVENFAEFCRAKRPDLMMTLNRMVFSYYSGSDVIIERQQDLSVKLRFSNQLADQFSYREVGIEQELDGMKLAYIR